jgi:Repeat of unknown function (DUF5648)
MWRSINIMRCVRASIFAGFTLTALSALSADLEFVGTAAYSYSGNSATMTAESIQNFTPSGTSGAARLELWAFPSAYNGAAQTGYKLGEFALGQLPGGSSLGNVNSGAVPFTFPPDGVWTVTLMVTEFDGSAADDGFGIRDWFNVASQLVVGIPSGNSSISIVGSVGYSVVGGSASLTADRIQNDSASGVSGALRLEVWAFVDMYTGGPQVGYKVAQYDLPQLSAGLGFNSVSSGPVPFDAPPRGTWQTTMFVTEFDDGPINDGYSKRASVNIATPLVSSSTATAVEYYYAAWDHYFVTSDASDIAILDGGAFGGVWKRTGQTFDVWAQPSSNLLPACRFFGVGFAPKSSHFFTPFQSECDAIKNDPNWEYESIAFYLETPDVNGLCPTGTAALYRLYNNFAGGAPNHRYTASRSTLASMKVAGWTFEGNATTAAFACVPNRTAVAF